MGKRLVKVTTPVKDLLFKKFKRAYGLKVFLLQYSGDREKEIFKNVLSGLKDRNYLNYVVNSKNIQIFLSDKGRELIDSQEQWEVDKSPKKK